MLPHIFAASRGLWSGRNRNAMIAASEAAVLALLPKLHDRRCISVKATQQQTKKQAESVVHAAFGGNLLRNNPQLQSNGESISFTPGPTIRPANTPLVVVRICGILVRALVEGNQQLARSQLHALKDANGLRALSVEEITALLRLLASHQVRLTLTPDGSPDPLALGPDHVAVHELDELLELLVERTSEERARTGGPQFIPVDIITAMIRCHVALQETSAAARVWEIAVQAGILLSTEMLNLVLTAYAADGNRAAVEQMIEMCMQEGSPVQPDMYSYVALIDAHAIASGAVPANDQSSKLSLIRALQNEQALSNRSAATASDPSVDTGETAEEETDSQDASNAQVAARSESKNNAEEMLEILNLVKQRGIGLHIQLFNHLIQHFARNGAVDSMMLVLDRMKLLRFEPNTVTYNNLIHGFVVANRPHDAIEMLKRMSKDAMTSEARKEQCAPDVATYNILIDMYARRRDGASALRVFEQMSSRGITPNVVSFNTVMEAYRKMGDVSNAQRMFYAIEAHGLRPTHASYTSMIAAYGFNDMVAEARRMFDMMQSVGGVAPKRSAYGAMMGVYAKQKNYVSAREVFEMMLERGIQPDARSVATLMQAAVLSGQSLCEVEQLYELADGGTMPLGIGEPTPLMRHWLLVAILAESSGGAINVHDAVARVLALNSASDLVLQMNQTAGRRMLLAATACVVMDAIEKRADVAARQAISAGMRGVSGRSEAQSATSAAPRASAIWRAAAHGHVDRRDAQAAIAAVIATGISPANSSVRKK